jgi:hypothetical protein
MSVASKSTHLRVPQRRHARAVLLVALCAIGVGAWVIARNSSPPVVAQTRPVAPFTSVELAGSNDVTVLVGARQSVSVRARKDMLDHVSTQVRARTLVIADVPGRGITKGPISVSVAVPTLTSFALAPGGSGMMDVGPVANRSLTVALAGSGLLRARGITDRLTVRLTGSGDLELGQLTARDARVAVSGSGRAAVTATRSLAANLSGSGMIQYGGNPAHLSTSVSGSGVIIPG